MRVRLTRAARDDLQQTSTWIAQHNPEAAYRFLRTMKDRLQMVGTHPEIGRARDDLAPGLRGQAAGRHLVLYRAGEREVTIVRVLDGRRDLHELFKD